MTVRQSAGGQVRGAALRRVRAVTWPPAMRQAHGVAVGALTALVAAGYSVFAFVQYETYRVPTDDMVIFTEAIQSYAHFKPGISPIRGLHYGYGPNFSELGDHFSPILAVLAPLEWIHSGAVLLLLAQAVLFALAIPPLWVFTRRAFGGGRKAVAAAYLVSAAYAVSWPLASALTFSFHEVAFAPLLMAVVLERLQAGRLRTALIMAGLVLLIKEDMGLFLAGLGIYLAVTRSRFIRQRLIGAALIVGGVAYTWIAADVIIPAMGGRANQYWAYNALGPNVPQAALHAVIHPLSTLHMLVTPDIKVSTMLWLFGAFCFLSLLSPMTLIALPLLVERMLATNPGAANWWVTSYQYNAFVVVILICAAVDGAARLDRLLLFRKHRVAVAAGDAAGSGSAEDATAGAPPSLRGTWNIALAGAAAMLVTGLVLVPRFGFDIALHRSFFRQTPETRTVAALNARIPSGATVAALNIDGSQLAGRDTVLFWDGDGGTPPTAAPWVVANVTEVQFTFSGLPEQLQRVHYLEQHGYSVVFSQDGYLLLHRPGPPELTGKAAG